MLKLSSLVDANETFADISRQDLPINLSYRISRNISIMEKELTRFNEYRNELLKKYGKPVGEGGGTYNLEKDQVQAFQDEIKKLLDEEVDVYITPVTLSDLTACNIKIKPVGIHTLMIAGFVIDDLEMGAEEEAAESVNTKDLN